MFPGRARKLESTAATNCGSVESLVIVSLVFISTETYPSGETFPVNTTGPVLNSPNVCSFPEFNSYSPIITPPGADG